jgi:molybdopterin-containing oxidoreductase family iron-sulfur binding subunit
VSATYKGQDGLVSIDYERCIGCRYCMTACPYGVRQFNWQKPLANYEAAYKAAGAQNPAEAAANDIHGYPLDYRTEDGRLVFTPRRPKGVVEKCTFCVEYINQGLAPACVRACTGNARIFGDLSNPFSQISDVVRSEGLYRLREDLDTHPRVYYIPADSKRGKGNVSYNPEV